jgi:hypothetical protein
VQKKTALTAALNFKFVLTGGLEHAIINADANAVTTCETILASPSTLRDNGNYKIAQNGVKFAKTGGYQKRHNPFTCVTLYAMI